VLLSSFEEVCSVGTHAVPVWLLHPRSFAAGTLPVPTTDGKGSVRRSQASS